MSNIQIIFIISCLGSFGLGYLFCRMNYFFNAIKTSIVIVRLAQVVSLTILTRAMENFYFSRTYRIQQMKKAGDDANQVKEFDKQFMNDYTHFKKKSIDELLEAHRGVFEQLITFNNWHTAMHFLNKHKQTAFQILKEKK